MAKHFKGPDYLSQQIEHRVLSGMDFTLHKIAILV